MTNVLQKADMVVRYLATLGDGVTVSATNNLTGSHGSLRDGDFRQADC